MSGPRRRINPLTTTKETPEPAQPAGSSFDQPPVRRAWSLWLASGLFALGWLVFTWPWLSGKVTIPWDAKAHFQAQFAFLVQALQQGQSPFWTPYVFSGHPQIADPQSLIFQPLFLLPALFGIKPSLWLMDALVFAMLAVGGFGIILLFRERGWHWAGAVVAALCFAFGASAGWRVQHVGQILSLSYLPLAWWCLERGLARGSARYGAAAAIFAALMVLGRDQVAMLGVWVLLGVFLWHLATAPLVMPALRKAMRPVLVGSLVGIVIIALPLLMTIQLAENSNRPAIDFIGAGRGSLHPALLLTAFTPHLYGAAGEMAAYWGPPSFAWQGTDLFLAQNMGVLYIGAVPLLLIVTLGLMRGEMFRRDILFVTLAFLIMLLYGLGWFTPVFRVFFELIPGVNLYRRPADATFLIGALAAVLAGYLTHQRLSGPLPPAPAWLRLLGNLVILAGFVLAFLLAWRMDRLTMAGWPLAWAALWFAGGAGLLLLAKRLQARAMGFAAALMLTVFTAGDLAINNGPNGATGLAHAAYDVLRPDTENETIAQLRKLVQAGERDNRRDRVELVGLGFEWPNATMVHGFEHSLGYNPVRLAPYVAATGAGDTIAMPDQKIWTPLLPSYRSLLADLLGLRFIVTSIPVEEIDKKLQPGDLIARGRTKDGYIYENPRALPRVMAVCAAKPADFSQILRSGVWPAGFNPQREVLLDSYDMTPGCAADQPNTLRARILSYDNTQIIVESNGTIPGHIVLNDIWHPWWTASIDGQPVAIRKANVLFRAVRVPAGRHVVHFRFEPLRGALVQLFRR
jgi:hypothetical protein